MNDPWEAAKTATAMAGISAAYCLAAVGLVGVLVAFVWVADRMTRGMSRWPTIATSIVLAFSAIWAITFVATLFFGTPR